MELTTEATITKAGIKTEAANYAREAATVLDLSFSLRLPKPQPALTLEAWSDDYSLGRRRVEDFKREQAAKAQPKKKGKKSEPIEICDDCGATLATDDEALNHECPPCVTCGSKPYMCECPPPVDEALAAYLKPFYDEYVAEKRAHNREAMLASQHAAMFISLINTPVKISLSPVQEGMLFALEEGSAE